jgi:hypothetical protein
VLFLKIGISGGFGLIYVNVLITVCYMDHWRQRSQNEKGKLKGKEMIFSSWHYPI